MITVTDNIEFELNGEGEARAVLIFQETTGVGIRSVSIFGRAGEPILDIVQPFMCPTSHPVLTPWVSRMWFPLRAEATDCAAMPMTATREDLGPLYENVAIPETDIRVGPPRCSAVRCPPSETRACADATREAFEAASALEPICEECANLDRLREEHNRINTAAWMTVFISSSVAVALAVLLPWPANLIAALIALTVAAAALAIAIWALGEEMRFARELEACRARMEPIRMAFANASATVRAECCCYVIPIPSC